MSKAADPRVIDFLLDAISHGNNLPSDLHETDWDAVWTKARDHCIVPYLHQRWSDSGVFAALPQHFAERLAVARAKNSERNRRLAATLNEFHHSLESRGISVLVSKGLSVAQEFYGDVGLRVVYDLDFIVQSKHRSEAAAIFERLGYRPYFPKRRHSEKEGELYWQPKTWRWDPELVFEPEQPVFVELHTLPWVRRWHGFGVECLLDLWDRHRELEFSGISLRVPCCERLLVHLAVHYAFNVLESNARLMHLLDIVLVLQRRGNQLDWDLVWNEIEKSRVAPLCCIPFALSEQLRPGCIPHSIRKRIWAAAPGAIRDWLNSAALCDVARVNVHNRDQSLIYFLHWNMAAASWEKLRVLLYSCRAPLSEAAGGFSGWKAAGRRVVHRVQYLARGSQIGRGAVP